jgi:hypothetical protein
MTATLDAQKTMLIQDWGARLYRSAASGKLDAGKPFGVQPPRGIAGPRAAVLEFNAGLDADRFLRKLQSSDGAIVLNASQVQNDRGTHDGVVLAGTRV